VQSLRNTAQQMRKKMSNNKLETLYRQQEKRKKKYLRNNVQLSHSGFVVVRSSFEEGTTYYIKQA
jgi:hypothetical protein